MGASVVRPMHQGAGCKEGREGVIWGTASVVRPLHQGAGCKEGREGVNGVQGREASVVPGSMHQGAGCKKNMVYRTQCRS